MRIDIMTLFPDAIDADLLVGGAVYHPQPQQLLVEKLPLGQVGVGAANGYGLSLQSQGRVHVVHAGQGHQHRGLMDPGAADLHRLIVYINGVKFREKLRVKAMGVYLDLSPDAVGVDDLPHGDECRPHSRSPLLYK